jgi:F-type H+-transporting ATPase subunit epsilon
MTPAPRSKSMRLIIRLPASTLFEEDVTKLQAKAENGWFGLLPRHIDFVTALAPGVMTFQPVNGQPEYLAHDHGILVKCGREVAISTRSAVRGTDIARLNSEVEMQFLAQQEREKAARALEARLEADLVRRLLQTEKDTVTHA